MKNKFIRFLKVIAIPFILLSLVLYIAFYPIALILGLIWYIKNGKLPKIFEDDNYIDYFFNLFKKFEL